jgi:fructose-1,6-bisphosphatase/inositol monophosphatase family enzyme
MISADEWQAVIAILAEAARTEIMPRFRRLAPGDIRAKTGPQDLVTEADTEAERAITAALHSRFPGCVVVGEEAVAADPALLDRIGGARLAFVVDPVDGTFNFQAGIPLFGVMAAAIEGGAVTAGAILDPVVEDTACALRGQGAWAQGRGGRRALRVADPVPVAEMGGTGSFAYLAQPARSRLAAGLSLVAATWSYRCAAHEYRTAVTGQCHFLQYSRLMPWDHAPGWLIHQEAGGYSAMFDGSPYSPLVHHGGLICATDEASWHSLRAVLLGETP